jgi:YVTN family beta-propeller protein
VLRRKGRPSRFLAAVVFTDIAGSTEVAARLGDEGWKRLLERHLRLIRSALQRFGGREIDTAGDGLYATFDSPAQAIAFALDVAERVEALGIRVRSGIHMGEVELIGGKAGGIAVHIGARIAGLAEPGEALVSGTVRDLVTGSAVEFEERGTHELKGVPGQWALYAARALERPVDLPPEARTPWMERASTRLRSRRWRVTLVVVVIAALLGSAFGTSLLLQPRYLPGVEANSIGRIGADGKGILGTLPVGRLPDAIAFGEGALWVTDTTTGTIARIDPADSRLVQTIKVGSSPNAVAVGHGAVWVANGIDRTVSRVSPATNQEVAKITVGNGPSGVATDDRWVWATNRLDGTLARIDPQDHALTTFPVGTTPAGVATGAGSVWVSDFDTGSVIRVDPASGAPGAPIHVGNGPAAIVASGDQVWVVNSRDGTVSRVDPSTNGVVATIALGGEPGAIAVAGSVWVTVASTAEVVRIDPATNTIARRIPVQSRPRGIAMAGGDAWFTARAATGSHRGGTLRIAGTDFGGYEHLGITNDGLLNFKQVGGSDGLTLVADLATSIPTPTDDGRTYAFQLRPGIVYSDGTPVRALDVRRSIEGVFSRPDYALYALEILGALDGAQACSKAPGTCDLSRSIAVDDAAGTVVFRLNRADAEFLYKLAAETVVMPAATPFEPTSPPPATGPYMVASGYPEATRLIRNPLFREWSHEAQPEGYPDEIVWLNLAEEDRVDPVVAGDADYVLLEDAPDRVTELSTRFTDQLHTLPPKQTFFEFMNTTMPPFNNPEVRRAVNLATDRGRIVELAGGPLVGRVTCQAKPPGFPGYEPYCPYTVSPGGAWRAPDITAARDAIDRAGVRGTPITVWALSGPEHTAFGGYFVELLNELGFDASLKRITLDELFAIEDPYGARIQMIGVWFLPSYLAPSDFTTGLFTCPDFRPSPGGSGNYAAFCDADVDARALQAYDLQLTDPSAANRSWAEIDRLVVDKSPAVAAYNPIALAFVSKRVGNVQINPLRVLISQMWVQ